jgi:epoxyqueuosine reductase
LKDQIPGEFKGKMENWAFGCDICQDVCPWNRFSRPNSESAFNPSDEFQNLSDNDWIDMSKEVFNKVFKNSALKRTKFEGMQRNISFVRKSTDKKNPN